VGRDQDAGCQAASLVLPAAAAASRLRVQAAQKQQQPVCRSSTQVLDKDVATGSVTHILVPEMQHGRHLYESLLVAGSAHITIQRMACGHCVPVLI
jgi:hypothetical protein